MRIDICDRVIAEAQGRLADFPVLPGSHRKEAANVVGILGEVAAEVWLYRRGVEYRRIGSTRHDYVVVTESGELTLEIKTKDRTCPPRSHYDCSVPLYNHDHQCPDWYLFVSLQRPRDKPTSIDAFECAHILGMANRDRLHRLGKVWRAGEVDERNGTKFWTDCWNVRVGDLLT